MKIRRTCREVTHLVLEGHDRLLLPVERLSLQLHWLVCAGCRQFRGQARLMQRSMARWRAYRDAE